MSRLRLDYGLFAAVNLSAIGLAIGLAFAGWATAQTQTAVEYYYADWNFYFETSFPDEIAALDGGAFGGAWRRTGQTFQVWPSFVDVSSVATCRFFSVAFAPKSSHFYTPFANECAIVKTNAAWQYEAIAFYIALADANGMCPAGTMPLYRAYNNGMGGAPNHRYTINLALLNQMIAAGWIFEGNGLTKVFACVPPSAAPPPTAEGAWFGSLSSGANATVFILDTGLYYIFHSSTSSNALVGVGQGTLVYANGTMSYSDGLDFANGGGAAVAFTVSGSFVSHSTLNLTIVESATNLGFTGAYFAAYDQPFNLAAAAGTFSGKAGFLHGLEDATVTLDPSGVLSGTIGACSFMGTATPHGGSNLLNVVFTFNGGPCSYGMSTFKGIAFSGGNELEGAATDAGRTDFLSLVLFKP
jgi:hypothetical protein